MNTKQTTDNLRLLADTIEELEIDNIIECRINPVECHLVTLKLTNIDSLWIDRHDSTYPWEKEFYHNNIRFFALYTQEQYDKETSAKEQSALIRLNIIEDTGQTTPCGFVHAHICKLLRNLKRKAT